MEKGCFGDFSFPAGRPHCDPLLKAPFTVLPLDAERSYDMAEARPLMVGKGQGAPEAGKGEPAGQRNHVRSRK